MSREERINKVQHILHTAPPSYSPASRLEELERLKKEQNVEEAEFKMIFNKIIESDSWPMVPRPEQGIVENRYADMVKLVDTLSKSISELNISVKKMREDQSATEETPTVTSRKRGRLSDGGLDNFTFNVAELQEGVSAVENQLHDLQNSLLNHDNDIQAEVVGLMENRYDELEAARNAGTDPEAQFRQLSTIKLSTMEKQIEEVALEMADVINRSFTEGEDHEQVKRENAALLGEINMLRAQVQTWESREAESVRHIAVITAALDDYKSHPAAPPVPIAPEHLRPHIESVVLPVIRDTVYTMIDELRANLQQTMNQREMEIYGALYDKLKLAGTVSETVVARMQSPLTASSLPASK